MIICKTSLLYQKSQKRIHNDSFPKRFIKNINTELALFTLSRFMLILILGHVYNNEKIPSEIEVAPSYKLLILLHSFQCCIVYTIYTAYTAYIAFIAHTCYTAYTVGSALEQKGYHAYKYDIGF